MKFFFHRSRRPVPSLTNPMGNSNVINTNMNQGFLLGNGNGSHSQNKKASGLSSQNNMFSFLPTSSNQNKYGNMQASFVPSMSNSLQRTPMMTNFMPVSNGQASTTPPPSSHILNGSEIDQNFPPMNVR